MKSGAAAKRLANVVTLTFCDLQSKPRHSPATSRRPARPSLSARNWRGSVLLRDDFEECLELFPELRKGLEEEARLKACNASTNTKLLEAAATATRPITRKGPEDFAGAAAVGSRVTTLSASQEQREQDFLTKCRSVGQTTSSSISQQAAARTRQSRYGSMSRQSSSRRSIANLVNGSPRRSSTLANGAAEGEMIDPDQLV